MTLLIINLFLCSILYGQTYPFNAKKWKRNSAESYCYSYRSCVDLMQVFEAIKGKTKKEVIKILGRPIYKEKDDNNIMYMSYLVLNKKELRKMDTKTSSMHISIIFNAGRAVDLIYVSNCS